MNEVLVGVSRQSKVSIGKEGPADLINDLEMALSSFYVGGNSI